MEGRDVIMNLIVSESVSSVLTLTSHPILLANLLMWLVKGADYTQSALPSMHGTKGLSEESPFLLPMHKKDVLKNQVALHLVGYALAMPKESWWHSLFFAGSEKSLVHRIKVILSLYTPLDPA